MRAPDIHNDKTVKPGREFELLIARLEEWLGPLGAVIKSPDHLPDRNSGRSREVDASIRHNVGSSSILVIVECRDRRTRQDVRWIEELSTKKESVCADKVIAVSAKGFSKEAEAKASSLGIETRRIRDITAEDAANWARKTVVTLSLLRWKVLSIVCVVPKCFEPVSFRAPTLDEVQRNPTDVVFGFEKKSRHPVSVRTLLDHVIETRSDLLDDVFTSNEVKTKSFTVDFPDGEFCFQMATGFVDAKQMQFRLEMWPEFVKPAFKVLEYSAPAGTILRVATASVEVEPGRRFDMILSETPPVDLAETA